VTRQAAAPGSSAPEVPARRKKILLVDDSMTALMMNRMLLSKCGCDIVTARDGREAIDRAFAERPDLIVMDIVMPQMNGFEACKRLRASPVTRATPILLVTTRGEAESIATGFASGCTDYVTKPVNSVELLSKIKAYLGD
jgi:CheY-like chemotaxis protein